MTLKCMKFKASGRVQGVGFRYHTAYQGLKIGVTGYAKNLSDGDVEVVVCGNEQQLLVMDKFLQQGPKGARVDSLTQETMEYNAHQGFEVL